MLLDVQINKVKYSDSGNRITIALKMPCYPDYPPKKWSERNYNSVILELDFLPYLRLKISA